MARKEDWAVGDRVKLSKVEPGDAVEFDGDKIVITANFPPDKDEETQRMIEYYYEDGQFDTFFFTPGKTPIVTYLGTGSVQVIVKFNDC